MINLPVPYHAVDTTAFRGGDFARDYVVIQTATVVQDGAGTRTTHHEVDAWSILTRRWGTAVDDWLDTVAWPEMLRRMGVSTGEAMSNKDGLRAIKLLGVTSHPDLVATAPPEFGLTRYLHEIPSPPISELTAPPDYGE